MKHFWSFIGALMLASGVALGAYGAHGLHNVVTVQRSIDAFEYAVLYQLISGLGFFAIAWGLNHFREGLVNLAGLCVLIGSLGFSVSLYLLVLIEWRPFPLITPISGGFMIAAWVIFALASLTSHPRRSIF